MKQQISDYLRGNTESKIASLEADIRSMREALLLLKAVLAGEFPEAYLTHVTMEDDPLVLFVGDVVTTKYCQVVTISHFDYENKRIYFEEWKDRTGEHDRYLSDHRITYVETPGVLRRSNTQGCGRKYR